MILSFAMALKYSLDLDDVADEIDSAVKAVLKDGLRTPDIMEDGKEKFQLLKWDRQSSIN